jgi:integral membrane protein
VTGAVLRYRIGAYVVGTILILVFVQMYVRYVEDNESFRWLSIVHGFLYMIYLVLAFDVYRRTRWEFKWMGGMIAAGFVPFVSFIVERKVVARLAAEQAKPAAKRPAAPAPAATAAPAAGPPPAAPQSAGSAAEPRES